MRKILPPSDKQIAIRDRNKLIDNLNARIDSAEVAGSGLLLTNKELDLIEVECKAREYVRYQQNDSPKGETIPGVRFKIAA